MALVKRDEIGATAPADKQPIFRSMVETYKQLLDEGNHIGAYVVAFSYLEDRITAMDVIRHRVDDVEKKSFSQLGKMVENLQLAGDLPAELVKDVEDTARVRNDLFHRTMWNFENFTHERSEEVFRVAKAVDNARRRQKTQLGE